MFKNFIPHNGPRGTDVVCSRLKIRVPLVLYTNGADLCWHPEAMDRSAADRMVTAINSCSNAESFATRIDAPVIVPSAGWIQHETGSLEKLGFADLKVEPVRLQLYAEFEEERRPPRPENLCSDESQLAEV